jgi:hypothetical protein
VRLGSTEWRKCPHSLSLCSYTIRSCAYPCCAISAWSGGKLENKNIQWTTTSEACISYRVVVIISSCAYSGYAIRAWSAENACIAYRFVVMICFINVLRNQRDSRSIKRSIGNQLMKIRSICWINRIRPL